MKHKIAILERIDQSGIKKNIKGALIDNLVTKNREQILRLIKNYDIAIVKSRTVIDREFINSAEQLQIIGRAGTGTDNIDTVYAVEKNIEIITTPSANSNSAAEFTVSLILAMVKRLPECVSRVNAGDYRRHLLEGREFSQLSVGVVGLGRIGLRVAHIVAAFGCTIWGYDTNINSRNIAASSGINISKSFREILGVSDIVTFHIPLKDENIGILNCETISLMKRGSLLVNTSRGQIIDESALLQALDSGKIQGAALDVISNEPSFDADPPTTKIIDKVIDHPKIFFTPHMAASTVDAQREISNELGKKIAAKIKEQKNLK